MLTTEPERPPDSAPRIRWLLCGMLFLATTLNYLDRQVLGIVAPLLQRDLSLDNAALGWLFSVFYYTYTFAQFAAGPVLDRVNLRWAYGLAVVLWSAAGALTATARGFASLLAFRMLLGVMESANWPAAMRIVARILPPSERALGNGIFTSGTSVGALIAPGLVLWITHRFGWRAAFLVVGSFGAAWFLLWIFVSGHRAFGRAWNPERLPGSALSGYAAILRSARFWRVFCVTILVNPCLYYHLNWLPTYFVQRWRLDLGGSLGVMLTAIYVGLDLGYLTCGLAVMAMVRRGVNLPTARAAVVVAASVLLAASALVPLAQSPQQALMLLILTNFAIGIWIAMYLTMAQEVSSTRISTAAGLLGGSGSLAGALAMWAVGRVTQSTGSFSAPFVAVAAAGALAALAGLAVTRYNSSEESA